MISDASSGGDGNVATPVVFLECSKRLETPKSAILSSLNFNE
jgi:hypothetical protein